MPESKVQTGLKTLLATLPLASSMSADAVGFVCPESFDGPISRSLENYKKTVSGKGKAYAFRNTLAEDLKSHCSVDELSEAEIESITKLAYNISVLDPAIEDGTMSKSYHAERIAQYTGESLEMAFSEKCSSDIGASGALFDCLCTNMSLDLIDNGYLSDHKYRRFYNKGCR